MATIRSFTDFLKETFTPISKKYKDEISTLKNQDEILQEDAPKMGGLTC